jgi:hypothetical protein
MAAILIDWADTPEAAARAAVIAATTSPEMPGSSRLDVAGVSVRPALSETVSGSCRFFFLNSI